MAISPLHSLGEGDMAHAYHPAVVKETRASGIYLILISGQFMQNIA